MIQLLKKQLLFALILICMPGIADQESFVVKKKCKGPSLSTIKEDYAQLCADLLQLAAQTFEKTARFNIRLLQESLETVNQEAGSLFVKGDKQTLQDRSQKMTECKKKIEDFNKYLDSYLKY